MNKSIVKNAKTIEDAISLGLSELDLERDEVDIEVLEKPEKRFFGLFGSTEAKVKLIVLKNPSTIVSGFLESVLETMGIKGKLDIEVRKNDLYIDIVDISSKDKGIIIGKRGNTLDSLQYLASLVVNKESEKYVRISLDCGNYRQKREDTLRSLARKMADKSKSTKRPVKLEPMNPYERRIIHSALQKTKDIKTYSEGKDPYRRIVIESK